jgi:predicted lipoprotein with Yx(FWY)xxD motif
MAIGAICAATMVLAACGAGNAAAPGSKGPATVSVSNNAKIGTILVNAQGMTLYRFSKDTKGVSNCTGTCAGIWPPAMVSGTPSAAIGITGTLGTITRSSPSGTQLTCDGYPLYTYSGDKAAGDTNGQGYLHLWNAVTSSCGLDTQGISSSSSSTTPATTGTTSTTSTSGTGGGWNG